MALTTASIKRIKYDPNAAATQIAWDGEVPGFGIRTFASGAQSYILDYRNASGDQKRKTIGRFPAMSPDNARREARKVLNAVASGGDPVTAERDQRDSITVVELGKHYLKHVHSRRAHATAYQYERLWNAHIVPVIGRRKVRDVSTAHVAKLHRGLSETPFVANRCIAVLGAFFTYARREGEFTGDSPTKGLEKFREEGRERFLTTEEMVRLASALTKAETVGLRAAPSRKRKRDDVKVKHRPKEWDRPIPANPNAVAAIRLALLTGMRIGEVLSLRWDAIDTERGILTLRGTKTGKSIREPGAAALELLGSLPRADDVYVFPGIRAGAHLQGVRTVWDAVRLEAKLTDIRLHDLRHSFASTVVSGGASLLVAARLLGHKRVSTSQRYAHLTPSPVRAAADKASGEIAALLSGQRTAVTPISAAAGNKK